TPPIISSIGVRLTNKGSRESCPAVGLPPPAEPIIHKMQTRFSLAANTMKSINQTTIGALSVLLLACTASAASFSFSTGEPDGKIATLSRPASLGRMQTETADDFVTTQAVVLNQATFFGLLPAGSSIADITGVEVEIYHVFPFDSAFPPSGNVLNRTNSPSDVEIDSSTRDSANPSLPFSSTI